MTASPITATDLVCGMTVDTSTAASMLYQGQTYYFCSEGCHVRFMGDPASYVVAE